MKKLLIIALLIIGIGGLVYANGGLNFFSPATVKAFGDLTVDFHVPVGTPLFTSTNLKPGDVQSKPVDVTNGGSISHMVAVKGVKTGGTGQIENALTIVIMDGATPVYGSGSATGVKTVQNFFADSASVNGIILGTISHSGHKIYTLTVTFPISAGNQYQGKSVLFDLTFGTSDIKNVVINEVFYHVDTKHGYDSKKNRDHDHDKDDKNYKEQNDQWVELYNPTDTTISLKNWTITDNSAHATTIHENEKIKPKEFVILSKDDDIWKYWNKKNHVDVIELGHDIGDGLDDSGDHLSLKDSHGTEVDRMSWGTDMSGFTPPAINPEVPAGSSTERISAGFDTDKATDWKKQTPPTPGN